MATKTSPTSQLSQKFNILQQLSYIFLTQKIPYSASASASSNEEEAVWPSPTQPFYNQVQVYSTSKQPNILIAFGEADWQTGLEDTN